MYTRLQCQPESGDEEIFRLYQRCAQVAGMVQLSEENIFASSKG
jgi:hypothetical protein